MQFYYKRGDQEPASLSKIIQQNIFELPLIVAVVASSMVFLKGKKKTEHIRSKD